MPFLSTSPSATSLVIVLFFMSLDQLFIVDQGAIILGKRDVLRMVTETEHEPSPLGQEFAAM